MKIKDIYNYIFHNRHYTAIITWYSKSIKNYIVWNEFINHIPKSSFGKDSLEYKEYLYSKRKVLTNILDLYKRSDSIIRDYTDVILLWKTLNGLPENMLLTYNDRELLMSKVHELSVIREYKFFEKTYNRGLISYITEAGKDVNYLTLEEISKILSLKKIIIERNNIICRYIGICKQYPFATRFFLNRKDLCLPYNEQLKVVQGIHYIKLIDKKIKSAETWYNYTHSNIKTRNFEHFLENKEYDEVKIIDAYWKIRTNHEKGLSLYKKEHKGINESALFYLKQIVDDQKTIIQNDLVLQDFEKMCKYKSAIQIYLGSPQNIDDIAIDAKLDISMHQNKIKSIQRDVDLANVWFEKELCPSPSVIQIAFKEKVKLSELQEVVNYKYFLYQKKYLFESLMSIKKTYDEYSKDPNVVEYLHLPSSPSWNIIEETVKRMESTKYELKVKKDFLDFKSKYKEALEEFLSSNVEVDTKSFDGQLQVLKRSDEIILLNKEMKKLRKYRSGLYKPCLYLFFNKIDECDFTLDELRQVDQNLDKVAKLQNNLLKLRNLLSLYPVAGKLWLEENYDKRLLHKFSEPLLCCRRDVVNNLSNIEEQIQITDLYLKLKQQYPINVLTLIYCGKSIPEDNDFSTEAISSKEELINYEHIYKGRKHLCSHAFMCDIKNRDSKIRCILQSQDYGKDFTFPETISLNKIIKLAITLNRRNHPANQFTRFISQHLQSVLDYNYIHFNCDSIIPDNYELLSLSDREFINWVSGNNTLIAKVNLLRHIYEDGYKDVRFTVLNKFHENSRELYRYMLLHEDDVKNEDVRWKAEKIISRYPDAAIEMFGYYNSEFPSYEDALQIVRSEKNVIERQNEILRLRKQAELERRQKDEDEKKAKEREERIKRIQEEKRIALEKEILRKRQEESRICLELQNIKNGVSSWPNLLGGLPYNYLLNYYPTTCDFEASESEWADRWIVWNFKNTPGKTTTYKHAETLDKVIPLLKQKLFNSFGESNLKKLTLVCIPASNQTNNEARYKEFSDRLCRETGMTNSYDRIIVAHEKQERRSGGTSIDMSNLSLDEAFFKDRYILLFDDVITRGDSMRTFRNKMESLGAHVIAGLCIGLTTHER